MNPRTFCRERGYPSAIALTYSFDPLFFERVVLPDLWHGGTGEVVVIADQGQVEEAVTRCAKQVQHLGRRYRLTHGRAQRFHPKLIVRIGPQGAIVLMGSGNLTHGGWGGNDELAISWKVDIRDNEAIPALRAILGQIADYCVGSVERDAVTRIADQTWLAEGGESSGAAMPLLLTAPDRALAEELAQRWQGRRFTKMRVFTGSTDEGGRFIEWCHDTFGVTECAVALTPSSAAFQPRLLERLPARVTIAPKADGSYLHAKFYWCEGPDGNAAIVGSANCSAAAWLYPPNLGGNVEAVFVYDEATDSAFAKVLERFPAEQQEPKDVLGLGSSVSKPAASSHERAAYELVDLMLYAGRGEIQARVVPAVPAGVRVALQVDNEEIPLHRQEDDPCSLVGPRPEANQAFGTVFGRVAVWLPDGIHVTALRWIDDEEELRRAARERPLEVVFRNLRSASTPGEKSQLVNDVELVIKSLWGEPGAFPDPPRVIPEKQKKLTPDVPNIKPGDLVRTLADIEEEYHTRGPGGRSEQHVRLHGVMRALFGMLEDSDETPETEAPEDLADDDEDSQPPRPIVPRPRAEKSEVSDKDRRRLQRQIAELHVKLADAHFAQRCTATQLVHAIAFPLACAAMGSANGWISALEARDWVLRSTDLLFRVETGGGCRGLLRAVKARYEADNRKDVFDQVVGNGELWLALIGALGRIDWQEQGGAIERALAMREVVQMEDLVASANTERLSVLASRLKRVNEDDAIMGKAAKATEILAEIEAFLEKWFDFVVGKQEGERHKPGDLVWRKSGWGIARTEAPITKGAKVTVYWRLTGQEALTVASGYLVNYRLASQKYADLVRLDAALQAL